MPRLPRTIPRVSQIAVGRPVPVENSSSATYVKDTDGRTWIAKGGDDVGWNDIFAECVSWGIGRYVGANVPDGAVHVNAGGSVYWLSAEVPAYTHWDPTQASHFANPAAVGAMFALDAIVGEIDRHSENILLQPDPSATQLQCWAIDSGNALVGQPTDFIHLGLGAPDPHRNHARGLPVDALAPHAHAAASLAAAISEEDIAALVSDSAGLVREENWAPIAKHLWNRCASAVIIVNAYVSQLRGLK